MSTNYYLINKRERDMKKELDKLIEEGLRVFKNKLLQFDDNNYLNACEDIEDKIRNIKLDMGYGIFKPDEIHICKTNHDTLTWQRCDNWENEDQFIKYYEENKSIYEIQDDCSEVYSIEELLDEIHWDGQEVKYVSWDFC